MVPDTKEQDAHSDAMALITIAQGLCEVRGQPNHPSHKG
jgi:hypothetical protein